MKYKTAWLVVAIASSNLYVAESAHAFFRHRMRQQQNAAPIWPLLLSLGVDAVKNELTDSKDRTETQQQTGLPPAQKDKEDDNKTIKEMEARMLRINKRLKIEDVAPKPEDGTDNVDSNSMPAPKRPNGGPPSPFPNI